MSTSGSSTKWFGLAVQALLALHECSQLCSSKELSEKLQVNALFLRKVLTHLVKADLVSAKEGRNGGYVLAKQAEEISLFAIYEAIRNETYANGFIDTSNCENLKTPIHDALVSLRGEMEGWILEGLSQKKLADLIPMHNL